MAPNPIRECPISIGALGVETRVLDAGAGPTVLMLHGNPDNADEWALLIARLSERFRCIAPDFPGYGRSPEPPASFTYSLAQQMQFVDAILRAMGVTDPVALVVHDTGGMVGTAWAAANPDRLRGMVVTNTVTFDGFPWFPIARQWGDQSWLGRMRSSLAMAALGLRRGALFKRIFAVQCPQLDAGQLERFATTFAMNRDAKRTTLRQFRQFMRPGFFKDFAAMRERILARTPVRVLWGDGDSFIPVRFAQSFGAKQVTILPNAGHWVALTDPDALAREVEAIAA
jgi:pimeloyl-ACP methyl ester carboxylesterase